jgi:hypothetical protein
VKLKLTLEYTVHIDETFEGVTERLTREEAVEEAREMAQECVFLSYDDSEYEEVKEGEWELVSHSIFGDEPAPGKES